MAACGGGRQRDSIDSLPRTCGGGVFDLSTSMLPATLSSRCLQETGVVPGSIGSGRVRLTLVARGCQPPTHATTKLPLKGDPAMAAGLVVFRFRGELSPFPSTFSILSLSSPCSSDLANQNEMVADGGGVSEERRKERERRRRGERVHSDLRSFKGMKGEYRKREKEGGRLYRSEAATSIYFITLSYQLGAR